MPMIKSGAGAAVASGASFQARVAAYIAATFLCNSDAQIVFGSRLRELSFETAEAVDDLNLALESGETVYLQAKAVLSYSVKEGSELSSVLTQFVRQALSTASPSKYVLVTTGRAAKKIIYDLRAALDAFRSAPEEVFGRDQPQTLQKIIEEIRSALERLVTKHATGTPTADPNDIIRTMYVVVLDVEHEAPLEEASIVLLQANGFAPPRAVWGKFIADALTHAKQRHTVKSKDLLQSYARFRTSSESLADVESEAELLRIELGDMDFPAGKEVVLCELNEEALGISPGPVLLELYRFDQDCNERCKFSEEAVELLNGQKFRLIRRSATMVGMSRILEANPKLIGDRQLTIVPMNTEEDFEVSTCAQIHRERLRTAALTNQTPMACLQCGKPVSAKDVPVVETGFLNAPRVGLVHDACLQPADRLIGMAKSEFFQRYPELINFDANAWFKAAHGGQMAFAGAEMLASAGPPILAWGGREPAGPLGDYVVEVSLETGESEIVTERNAVHRFSNDEAEEFVANLNKQFKASRESGDPLCYSDQSKTFGPRSLVLGVVGGSEAIRPVEKAEVRKFRTEFGAQYSRPGQWYAPVLYMVRSDTGEPVGLHGAVFMITDPLTLGNHLANWKVAGLLLHSYEVRLILTDAEFDQFMTWVEDQNLIAVANPIFDATSGDFISGLPVASVEALIASAPENTE
jgi:hypothetical protein